MPHLILPKDDLKRIIRRRRALGLDRYDEVWNGVYVMSPIADNDHQEITGLFTWAIRDAIGRNSPTRVFPGANVSDQIDRWTKNFRVPDVLVFSPGNTAEDRGTHWLGGPDFAIEIVSRDDHSREKLEFYAKVGVRELLLIDRKPWRLELFRERDGRLESVGTSDEETSGIIDSEVLPLSFRLISGSPRPRIEATHQSDGRDWLI